MKPNLSIDALFPSKFLKAGDFDGEDMTLTITDLQIEKLGPEKEDKPVLYFLETEKGLCLNKTNADTISALYGRNCADWEGNRVILFPTQVMFSGKTSMGIRVKPINPDAKKKPRAAFPSQEA